MKWSGNISRTTRGFALAVAAVMGLGLLAGGEARGQEPQKAQETKETEQTQEPQAEPVDRKSVV